MWMMTQPLTHPQTNWASPITTTTLGDTTVTINGSEASSEAGQITLTIDRTPDDAFETAELKLQGICPACRCTDGEHEWNCKNFDYSITGNINNGTVYAHTGALTFSTTSTNSITLGNETLSEEKLKKLNNILDLFDDDEIEKRLTSNKNSV
jgi:hypothetical protein|tara:strand:- start:374 stop:829 length:456 start_codon:yes stop_codon:yes gene_type:complete